MVSLFLLQGAIADHPFLFVQTTTSARAQNTLRSVEMAAPALSHDGENHKKTTTSPERDGGLGGSD